MKSTFTNRPKKETGFLSKCDLFGPQFTFEYNNSNRFISNQGGCITLLLIFLLGVITVLVGKETFLRRNPSINYYSAYSDAMKFYINEIPLAFSFINSTNESIMSAEQVNSIFAFSYVSKANLISNLVNCEPSLYNGNGNYSSLISDLLLVSPETASLLCINETILNSNDFILSKDYSEINEYSFELNAVLKNPENRAKLSEIRISTYYFGLTMDLLKQKFPINYTMRSIKTKLKPNSQQIQYLYYQEVQIILDDTYLFSFGEKTFMNVKNLNIRFPNVAPYIDDTPFAVILSPVTRIEIFSRSYLKLSDSLALIGGLANALFICFKFMFEPYLRYLYFLFLKNFTYEFYQKEMKKISIDSSFKVSKPEDKFKNSITMLPINLDTEKLNSKLKETKKDNQIKIEKQQAQSSLFNTTKAKKAESAPLITRPHAFSNLISSLHLSEIHLDLSLGYFSYLSGCICNKGRKVRVDNQHKIISEIICVQNYSYSSLLTLKKIEA